MSDGSTEGEEELVLVSSSCYISLCGRNSKRGRARQILSLQGAKFGKAECVLCHESLSLGRREQRQMRVKVAFLVTVDDRIKRTRFPALPCKQMQSQERRLQYPTISEDTFYPWMGRPRLSVSEQNDRCTSRSILSDLHGCIGSK